MADQMDKRQTEIREGAGLEESRLNQEFIDLLKKYLTPALMVVALGALGYAGFQRYKAYQADRLDAAWVELDSALNSRNPTTLVNIAEVHGSINGVPELARLTAADVMLESALRGLVAGGELDTDGKARNPDDVLTPEQREKQLTQAAEQYQAVLAVTGRDPRLSLYAACAHFGLAAVAETRGQADQARTHFQGVVAAAEAGGMPALADVAKKRLETLDQFKAGSPLISDAQVVTRPALPWPPARPASPADLTAPAPTPPTDANGLQLAPVAPLQLVPPGTEPAPTTPPAPPADAPKAPEKAPGTGG
jgi:hypothetical protein